MWRHLIYEEIMHIWEVLARADSATGQRIQNNKYKHNKRNIFDNVNGCVFIYARQRSRFNIKYFHITNVRNMHSELYPHTQKKWKRNDMTNNGISSNHANETETILHVPLH